jgi:hypothetical protein
MERVSVCSNERRRTYDLDYFLKGGVERRKGPWRLSPITDRRLGKERRKAMPTLDYRGPERRSGLERRSGIDRRKT